jgi:RNA-splicing ligase RtcB
VISNHPHEAQRRALVFDSAALAADAQALRELDRGVRDVDLASAPVVLPDFHHKSDMEMPSSVAVATLETIRPRFTSASVNCGMALIALDVDRPTEPAMSGFFRAVRERYPYPPGWRRELTVKDVARAAAEGARFAVDRYGLSPDSLERIEEQGRLDLEAHGGPDRLDREVPRMCFELSRLRFGTIGPSNHFVELQTVEELIDPPTAARLGLTQGQLTLQYHAGGGMLAGQVGRLYVPRRKTSTMVRAEMMALKPLTHLGSSRSLGQLRARMAMYFGTGSAAIPRIGDEGQRFMLANAAAMNYGFAFRAAIYANLSVLAERHFGSCESRLMVDSPHNSIYEEPVNGRAAIVHRHNACRAYPSNRFPSGSAFGETGQAILLPGTHRTSSYLCVAGSAAVRSLYSACHGAGTSIDRLERAGISRPHPEGHVTLRFRYSDSAPASVAHLDDRGIDETLEILTGNGLVRPIARLRPLAVLH